MKKEPRRELLVMRHAKSAWNTAAPTDFERPLNKRGKHAAPQVGKWLRKKGWVPDYIVASPAKRAHQTARRMAKAMGFDRDRIHWDDRVYEAPTRRLLEVLADVPADARRVLIIGHNPGLDSLVERLCGKEQTRKAKQSDGKLLTTAAVARLALAPPGGKKGAGKWASLEPGSARLLSLTRSGDMD